MKIKSFTKDVQEQIGYYVYKLIDPRTGNTFYVGKGKGNRVFAHVYDALKNYEGEDYSNSKDGDDVDDVSNKMQQIREIRNANLEVIHVIIRYGIKDEKTAYEVESAIIDSTPGLTNIQSGHGNERGIINADTLQKNLTLEEFVEPDFKYVIIKIKESTLKERGNDIYETVRKSWKVNVEKIKKYKYVLAVKNGVVDNVFEPERWEEVENEPGRYLFIGKEAPDDIKNIFLNKRIPAKYSKRGKANPVLYSSK